MSPYLIVIVEYGKVMKYKDYDSQQEFADAAGNEIAQMCGCEYSTRYS